MDGGCNAPAAVAFAELPDPMPNSFLLYGASGYVGAGAARHAVQQGLRPILAGRTAAKLEPLAQELGLEFRAFSLDDPDALDAALEGMPLVLHLAGPYVHTARQMVEACIRAGVHYLDINGEIPVLEAIRARDAEARAAGVMLMPAVGFDVVPTDCLAVHLHQRLPSGTHLALAFRNMGPAGLPPGTQRTIIELLPYPDAARRDGLLIEPAEGTHLRAFDFGDGPVTAARVTWGDAVTAFHSTGIPNIDNYIVLPPAVRISMRTLRRMRRLLAAAPVRSFLRRFGIRAPPSAAERSRTRTQVVGELTDGSGGRVAARLEGPEAGLDWTVAAALSVVRRVLAGAAPVGFQTPAGAYGPDLVFDVDGVTLTDTA